MQRRMSTPANSRTIEDSLNDIVDATDDSLAQLELARGHTPSAAVRPFPSLYAYSQPSEPRRRAPYPATPGASGGLRRGVAPTPVDDEGPSSAYSRLGASLARDMPASRRSTITQDEVAAEQVEAKVEKAAREERRTEMMARKQRSLDERMKRLEQHVAGAEKREGAARAEASAFAEGQKSDHKLITSLRSQVSALKATVEVLHHQQGHQQHQQNQQGQHRQGQGYRAGGSGIPPLPFSSVPPLPAPDVGGGGGGGYSQARSASADIDAPTSADIDAPIEADAEAKADAEAGIDMDSFSLGAPMPCASPYASMSMSSARPQSVPQSAPRSVTLSVPGSASVSASVSEAVAEAVQLELGRSMLSMEQVVGRAMKEGLKEGLKEGRMQAQRASAPTPSSSSSEREVVRLAGEVERVRLRQSAVESTCHHLREVLKTAVGAKDTQVGAVQSQRREVEAFLAAAGRTLSDALGAVKANAQGLVSVQEEVAQLVDNSGQMFAELDERLAAAEVGAEVIEACETEAQAQQAELQGLSSEVEESERRAQQVEGEVENIREHLETLGGQMRHLTGRVGAAESAVRPIDLLAQSIDAVNDKFESRTDALKTGVEQQTADVKECLTEMQALSSAQTQAQAQWHLELRLAALEGVGAGATADATAATAAHVDATALALEGALRRVHAVEEAVAVVAEEVGVGRRRHAELVVALERVGAALEGAQAQERGLVAVSGRVALLEHTAQALVEQRTEAMMRLQAYEAQLSSHETQRQAFGDWAAGSFVEAGTRSDELLAGVYERLAGVEAGAARQAALQQQAQEQGVGGLGERGHMELRELRGDLDALRGEVCLQAAAASARDGGGVEQRIREADEQQQGMEVTSLSLTRQMSGMLADPRLEGGDGSGGEGKEKGDGEGEGEDGVERLSSPSHSSPSLHHCSPFPSFEEGKDGEGGAEGEAEEQGQEEAEEAEWREYERQMDAREVEEIEEWAEGEEGEAEKGEEGEAEEGEAEDGMGEEGMGETDAEFRISLTAANAASADIARLGRRLQAFSYAQTQEGEQQGQEEGQEEEQQEQRGQDTALAAEDPGEWEGEEREEWEDIEEWMKVEDREGRGEQRAQTPERLRLKKLQHRRLVQRSFDQQGKQGQQGPS